jgi:hypothetical protein
LGFRAFVNLRWGAATLDTRAMGDAVLAALERGVN